MQLNKILKKVEWLKSSHPYGGACIRINNENVIYIDPSHLSEKSMKIKADLILITHSHEDHFSVNNLERLAKPTTIIVCPEDCKEALLQDHYNFNIYLMKSNESIKLNNIQIKTIPAYSSTAHPNSAGWLGYIIEVYGFKLYHSGDSGFIPEMNDLKNIDIAFLTVREPYMMSPKELVQAIIAFKPKVIIPIHWIEEEKDSIYYVKKCTPKNTKVIILKAK